MKQVFFFMKWISNMNANSPWGNNSKGNGSNSNNDSYTDDYFNNIQDGKNCDEKGCKIDV